MPSKSQKGNQFQDWCAAWILKSYPGSVVHNQKAVAKTIKMRDPKTGQLVDRWVSQRNDILGCIDILWIAPYGRITFIQCTMDSGVGRKLAELKKIPWDLGICHVEVWVKREPGRVDIMAYRSDKTLGKIISILRGKATQEAF
jgi:hypothetical protein